MFNPFKPLKYRHILFITLFMMGTFFDFGHGAAAQDKPGKGDRKPSAAGHFYPGSQAELSRTLAGLFSAATPCKSRHVLAVVAPHAGFVYSGIVAASSYNQLDPGKEYDNVFVIGSSHYVAFDGASVYDRGDYVTPLGKVPVNKEIAAKLMAPGRLFSFHAEADSNEHCIEVQVPFLQYHLKKGFRLVPIVIATQSEATCRSVAEALKPFVNERNLFVFSTDFSHYPSWADAKVTDKATCDAIVAGSPGKLVKFLDSYKTSRIPNLATNLCGWTSILTMLYMFRDDPAIKITPVKYMNSGDSENGDKQQVVGYWSLVVTGPEPQETGSAVLHDPAGAGHGTGTFDFSPSDKILMLKIARKTIIKYVGERRVYEPDFPIPDGLKIHAGVFVTLKKHGELRGCIGRFTADLPLYRLISEMAIASATEDSRFDTVKLKELGSLEIEISVLSPLKKIQSPGEIVPGRHGIYIKKGNRSGTFLPQVAMETGWNREEFLGHCARDKAGIGWDGWKDAEI